MGRERTLALADLGRPPVLFLAPPFLTGIAAALWLTPLAHLALGFTLGPWLLYPRGWKDLLHGSGPWRTRALLAFLAVSVAAPFGGLAIPFWTYARRRC